PQPWRQAAGVLRGMGYDQAAQSLSIERRVRERLADNTPRFQRLVSWFLHAVADYGFNPWKTVLLSVATIVVFAALYWGGTAICGDPNLRMGSTACDGQPLFIAVQLSNVDVSAPGGYPRFDPLAYSLGAFVPLFDLGTEPYWRANAGAGEWFSVPVWLGPPAQNGRWSFSLTWSWGMTVYWLFVLERFVGAILLAIAVTGFTGLLTRDER
ncbi:MAG: hypothetical protein KKF33_08955, partial [Alphaproteobacteria bacterium]|nr:hypothetical protein [Alphaproteobacteria bacterium]